MGREIRMSVDVKNLPAWDHVVAVLSRVNWIAEQEELDPEVRIQSILTVIRREWPHEHEGLRHEDR